MTLRPAPGLRSHGRCEVCHKRPVSVITVHASGVRACPQHPWCPDCAFPHAELICPSDIGRVRDQVTADAAVADVVRDLASLGIAVPRVPVELVGRFLGGQLGEALTVVVAGQRTAGRIRILSGLGATRFRLVAAHELTHCMVQSNRRTRPAVQPMIEEGLCELVAVVWLCASNRTDTDRHLRQTWANAHPIYGDGMRAAVRVARVHGVPAVIDKVIQEGRLP